MTSMKMLSDASSNEMAEEFESTYDTSWNNIVAAIEEATRRASATIPATRKARTYIVCGTVEMTDDLVVRATKGHKSRINIAFLTISYRDTFLRFIPNVILNINKDGRVYMEECMLGRAAALGSVTVKVEQGFEEE
jgi:hypothetical protein